MYHEVLRLLHSVVVSLRRRASRPLVQWSIIMGTCGVVVKLEVPKVLHHLPVLSLHIDLELLQLLTGLMCEFLEIHAEHILTRQS